MSKEKALAKTSSENGTGMAPSLRACNDQHAELGLVAVDSAHLKRTFSTLGILALGFNVCNSWGAIASTIAIAIFAGGSVSLMYGILVVAMVMLCLALSLAELAAICPTAGGQYHFVSMLAPRSLKRRASYICGFLGVVSWISISSSVSLVIANIIMSVVVRYRGSYTPERWHVFLLYQALNLGSTLYNVFCSMQSHWLYDFGFVLNLSLFVVVTIVCPAMAKSTATNKEVWGTFVNSSGGWPDGISFIIGLATSQFMVLGLDASLHMAEECLEPAKVIPMALIATVVIGSVSAFAFAVSMAYCITDVETILSSPTGIPIYALWEQSTRSQVAATIFIVCLLMAGLITLNAINQTSSRLTWSFANDDALAFSTKFRKMSSRFNVPVYALILNSVAVALIGTLFLASTTAFNSFINTAEITNLCSLAMPSIFVLWRRRSEKYLPKNENFRLPDSIGYFVHAASVIYVGFITVFFCFPSTLPVTSSNMNYCSAVLGCIAILGMVNWFVHGRKHYITPQVLVVE